MSKKRIPIGANPRVLAMFGWLFVLLTLGGLHFTVLPAWIGIGHLSKLDRMGVSYEMPVREAPADSQADLSSVLYVDGSVLDHPSGIDMYLSELVALQAEKEFVEAHPPGSLVRISALTDRSGFMALEEQVPYLSGLKRRMLILGLCLSVFCSGMAFWAFHRADRAALAEKLK